jgi:hypothetical protein
MRETARRRRSRSKSDSAAMWERRSSSMSGRQ